MNRMKRLVKKCEDFYVCAEIGEKGSIGYEHADDRKTMYQYLVYGKISLITIHGDNPTKEFSERNDGLVNLKKYLNTSLLLLAENDFYSIGFNTIHKNIDWDGKLVKESFTGNDDSWLIVYDGNPFVNGKSLKRFDYAKLENKKYNVTLNDGVIAVFTKKCLF